MNNNAENKPDSSTKGIKLFFILAIVFMVACFLLCAVFDYIDRTQYVRFTPVVKTEISDTVPDSEKININTATKEELMTLNGVGSVTADNIIYYRENNNGFLDVDELVEVTGIGPKTLDKLRPYITA